MSSKPNQKPNTSNELVIFNIDHLIENARKADAPNCAKSNITGKYPGNNVALLKVTEKEMSGAPHRDAAPAVRQEFGVHSQIVPKKLR